MKSFLKNSIVPHEGNNYLPHIFKEMGVLVIIFIVGALIITNFFGRTLILSESMLGEVYPAVVAALTNTNRENINLPDLKTNTLLEKAAHLKAEDMIANKYFAHISPTGVEPWDFIKKVGYEYDYAGENLAINYSDSSDVITAWMNSPGHKANILNQHYSEVGVATEKASLDGREVVFVVEMFGKPKSNVEIQNPPVLTAEKKINVVPKIATKQDLNVASNTENTIKISSTTEVLGIATTSDVKITDKNTFSKVSNLSKLQIKFFSLILYTRQITISLLGLLLLVSVISFILFLRFVKKHHISHFIYALWVIVFISLCIVFTYLLFAPGVILASII